MKAVTTCPRDWKAFLNPSIIFSRPDCRDIRLAKSSRLIEPSLTCSFKDLRALTESNVYPRALSSSSDKPDTSSVSLLIDLPKISAVTQPSPRDFSNEPDLVIISSTATPCSLATDLIDSLNASASLIPWSRICFHPVLKPSDNNLFRASADLPITDPTESEMEVSKSLASSKSPTIICQLCVQPDWAASLRVSHN